MVAYCDRSIDIIDNFSKHAAENALEILKKQYSFMSENSDSRYVFQNFGYCIYKGKRICFPYDGVDDEQTQESARFFVN